MPALTKQDRDALPAEAFAVPSRRKLPIHDADHVRWAWGEVTGEQAKLSDEERDSARALILKAAADLGVDTAAMHKIKGMRLQAMSLQIPEVEDHPNRHPFSGVLVRLDEPSDLAPHGSGNRKVQITRAAAEKALPSLLGMGVGITADLDGHDERNKVGVIMDAEIVDEAEGPAVSISGFFYASDFPDEIKRIRASASDLGFSFEARNIYVADPRASVLEVTELAFTGAAVLFKDKAAYHRTSLAASAAQDFDMTLDEMTAALNAALDAKLAPVTAELTAVKASAEALKAENALLIDKVQASRVVLDKVEPFAAKLEAAAAEMKAAGIGAAARNGHADILERMASDMRAEASRGTMPSSFYAGMYASAEATKAEVEKVVEKVETAPADLAALIKAEAEKLVAGIKAEADAVTAGLKTEVETLTGKLGAVQASAAAKSEEPARKTLAPAITALLAKGDLTLPEGDSKLDLASVDAALAKSGLPIEARMQAKAALRQAGKLD